MRWMKTLFNPVGDNEEAIVRREVDGVAVHFDRPASGRRTGAFPGMLEEARGLSQHAVLTHGDRYRAPARPVGHGHHRTGLIDIEMARHHFFFQAEDGIRDADVTGVQTCALPIWKSHRVRPRSGHLPRSPKAPGVCAGSYPGYR